MSEIWLIARSLGTGILVGIIFGALSLPIPAPGVAAGVAGVVGLYLGYVIITIISKRLKGE